MARINDVGGMQGFAPLRPEPDEPPFHADWEAHVFAMNRALIGRGIYNLDEFRDAIERLPPQVYLASSYYEKWLHAITALLAEKGVLTEAELAQAGLAEAGLAEAGQAEAGPADAEPAGG